MKNSTNTNSEKKQTQGILVNVYKNGSGDCTANGLSSKNDMLIMVDEKGGNFDCPHTTEEDFLVYVLANEGTIYENYRAVPNSLLNSGKYYMFGGNFVYSSDSRFPSKAPVKVFDRVEN